VILRSVGLEPGKLSPRVAAFRCSPFAPRGAKLQLHRTGAARHGKSYFFSEFSPYATLVSGGQATKATLFYNNARRKVGLVGYWDTVAFDEVGGIKVKDPDTIQIMKDFMANGRFSRGVEVIADASLSFVGNIDLSVEQIVNSTEYDLFQPLPQELDLAIMDRFACYLPGWEMPKNSSSFLTDRFGFITDYLAEAFITSSSTPIVTRSEQAYPSRQGGRRAGRERHQEDGVRPPKDSASRRPARRRRLRGVRWLRR